MGNVRKLNEISKTQTNLIPHFWYVKLGVFLPREGEEGSFANPREGGDEYMDKFIITIMCVKAWKLIQTRLPDPTAS